MRRLAAWGGLVVVTALGLAILLGAAEWATRRLMAHNNSFEQRAAYNLRYRTSGFVRQVLAAEQEVYALGEDGRVRPDRRHYRVDRHGLRSPGGELPVRKPAGELRILFLGGSHVFDLGCHDADDCPGYPELTGRALRAAGWPVRVLNGGVPGQDSRTFASQLSLEWHRFEPDLVVLASAWNDIKWMSRLDADSRQLEAPGKDTSNPLVQPVSRLDPVLGGSMLYRKARDRWWSWRLRIGERHLEGAAAGAPVVSDRVRALQQYRVNFAAAAAVARQIGALPVLALEERLVAADNDDDEKARIVLAMVAVTGHAELVSYFEACDGELRRLASELDLPVIELGPELASRRAELFTDHVHTTPEGSRALAAGYARELASILSSGSGDGEGEHLLDRVGAGGEHHQAVDAEGDAGARR